MLIFSPETVKAEETGSLFSSSIYTDDSSTVVSSIADEKVSSTYFSMGTGVLFDAETPATRKYFAVSIDTADTSSPLPELLQPVNININVNKSADKTFII